MKKTLLCIGILLWVLPLSAETVSIIVHPSNTFELNDKQIKNIFLGNLRSFAGKGQAIPLSLPAETDGFEVFCTGITGKNKKQWKAYWAKNLFTGNKTPPKEVANEEMIDLVSRNPNLIGFTVSASIPDSVKVIKTIQ